MNAPDFNFGSGRPGLPSVTSRSRVVASDKGREVVALQANIAPPDVEGRGFEGRDFRAEFFKYLSLVIKHRWVVLGACGAAIAIGVAITYTSTPHVPGIGHHPD